DSVAVDLGTEDGRAALRRLLLAADVVIEASRPRALAGLGAAHTDLRALGWDGVWLSINGHGPTGAAADRVAFGDDAAVAGGLIARARPPAGDGGRPKAHPTIGHLHPAATASLPVFCADAI